MTEAEIGQTTAIPTGCRFCPKPAVARCTACGLPFCPDHGSRLCFNCLAPTGRTVPPAAVLPSGTAYYVALILLAAGLVLAGFQAVRLASRVGAEFFAAPRPTATPAPSPTPRSAPSPTPAPAPGPTQGPAAPPAQQEYVVQPGDTLWTIAQRFGVSVEALAQANGIQNPDAAILQVGQPLKVPTR